MRPVPRIKTLSCSKLCIFFICMNLCSCESKKENVSDTTNYQLKATAQRLNAEVASIFKSRAAIEPESRFDFRKLDDLKKEHVEEVYFSPNFANYTNRDVMEKDSSVVTILKGNDSRLEVWEIWPVPRRIAVEQKTKE